MKPETTLLGIAIDVSGSMSSSIRNDQALDLSRLGGVEKGMEAMLEDSRKLAGEYGAGLDFPLRIFSYAFGLTVSPYYGDILSILQFAGNMEKDPEFQEYLAECIRNRRAQAEAKGEVMRRQASAYGGLEGLARSFGFGREVDDYKHRAEQEAREKLEREAQSAVEQDVVDYLGKRIGDTTLTAGELAKLWSAGGGSFGNASRFIFGSTPMCSCLAEIEKRFAREEQKGGAQTEDRILLIISDGEPTDGSPLESVRRMKDSGIQIACAYVTDHNIQAPRDLKNAADPTWPRGAGLMFEMASYITPPKKLFFRKQERSPLADNLIKSGWTVPDGAKLFIQVNHSDTLADFMRIVATAMPLEQLLGCGGM